MSTPSHNKSANYNSLRIFQWNCRSILQNASLLVQFLSQNDFHVLALQSLNTTSSKLPKLPNFSYPPIFEADPSTGKVYTAIYIHTHLSYNICSYPPSNPADNFYSCAITLKYDDINLNVASIYLPKGPSDSNTDWLKCLPQKFSGKWVITGDFNAHSPFWDKGCEVVSSNRFVENIVDSSFCLLNNGEITRIPDVSGHRPSAIDLTLISPELTLSCSWNISTDTLGSDHIPVFTILSKKDKCSPNRIDDKVPKYHDKDANWSLFESLLSFQDFSSMNDKTIDEMYSHFTHSVLTAADITLTRVKGSKHNSSHTGHVWWTKECEIAVNLKRQAFKSYVQHKSPENHTKMKKANLNCNKIIAQAKKDYWSNFCSSAVYTHSDLAKVWDKIKELKNGTCLPSCPIITDSHNSVLSDKDKSEIFAEVFSQNSQIRGLSPDRRTHRILSESSSTYADPVSNNDEWFNQSISLEELQYTIDSLDNKKNFSGY